NADRLAADLKGKGFSASVQGGGGSSGTLFRVRAGPAADQPAAQALAASLARSGFKDGRVGRQ
ncbi:MAG: SPOR domain-containing protein, partial [Gammaproteobacteria bacterium]